MSVILSAGKAEVKPNKAEPKKAEGVKKTTKTTKANKS